MTISIDNIVFDDFKKAAEAVRNRLLERTGKAVPLSELVELLITAELRKRTPEELARQFFAAIDTEPIEVDENQLALYEIVTASM